jgi:hypothetical protein
MQMSSIALAKHAQGPGFYPSMKKSRREGKGRKGRKEKKRGRKIGRETCNLTPTLFGHIWRI